MSCIISFSWFRLYDRVYSIDLQPAGFVCESAPLDSVLTFLCVYVIKVTVREHGLKMPVTLLQGMR